MSSPRPSTRSTCNYRCREQIVVHANTLISCDPRSSRRMRAHKDVGSVTLRRYASTEHEAQVLAEEITGRLRAGAAPASIAVLVRSGYRANDLVAEMRALGLPVSDWRGDTYQPAGRRTFAAAMSCLRGTLNNRQAERLCELIGIEDTGERDTDVFLHAAQERPVAAGLLRDASARIRGRERARRRPAGSACCGGGRPRHREHARGAGRRGRRLPGARRAVHAR